MSNICYICGKKPIFGKTIQRRGLAKKKGGVGKKITGISPRRFLPNLKKIKAIIDGSKKTVKVCAQCLKQGRVKKVV